MNTKITQPRIVSGLYKNFKLEVPQSARPITERVKTIMFDTIKDIIDKSSILDLFAGSGNIGIEALSRGAKLAIFVDSDKEATEILKENLRKLNLDKNTHKILNLDYLEFTRNFIGNFDIIFLDPPFKLQDKLRLDSIIDLLAPNGLLIYKIEDKQRKDFLLASAAEIILEKKSGINILLFIKKHL